MLVQASLCQTCSETTLLVFPRGGSNVELLSINDEMYSKVLTMEVSDTDCGPVDS